MISSRGMGMEKWQGEGHNDKARARDKGTGQERGARAHDKNSEHRASACRQDGGREHGARAWGTVALKTGI